MRGEHWAGEAARLLDTFEQPFGVGEYEFSLTGSLGTATARAGEDAQTLICHADAAVYHAKNDGRGRSAIFDDSMRTAVSDRLQLENDLRKALERDELDVAYQPIVRLADGTIAGAEALARWTHPTLGPIAPPVFIAVAEETGMIDVLGERILAKACRVAAPWITRIPDFQLSVNLSPRQLDAAGFLPRLLSTLADSGLPHASLTLEITESCVLSQDARTSKTSRGSSAPASASRSTTSGPASRRCRSCAGSGSTCSSSIAASSPPIARPRATRSWPRWRRSATRPARGSSPKASRTPSTTIAWNASAAVTGRAGTMAARSRRPSSTRSCVSGTAAPGRRRA